MRRKIVAGNWKMNKTPEEAKALCELLLPLVKDAEAEVVFCVPAIDIATVVEAVKGSNVKVGGENLYFEDKGAFTGEISADMLKNAGCEYVIIGHSERRGYFGETDLDVNKKIKKALEKGLTPIMCCGESLEQREQGITAEWVSMQVKLASFTTMRRRKRSACSTADPSTRAMLRNCSHSPTSTAAWSAAHP